MNVHELLELARQHHICVGLTADPTTGVGEEWVCTVGLSAIGAGDTPQAAIRAAMVDASSELVLAASAIATV